MFSQNFIQRHLLVCVAVVTAFCLQAAHAQNAMIVNFDENGVGTVLLPGATPITLQQFGNQPDPFDAASGLKPLVYNLVGITGAVPTDGDVIVTEPTTSPSGISDILRFEHGLLYVYSELPEPLEGTQLADVGIPALFQANKIAEPETGLEPGLNGLFGYSPLAPMPGSMSFPVTYNFVSDPTPTPEPGSLLALIPAGALMLIRRRRPIA